MAITRGQMQRQLRRGGGIMIEGNRIVYSNDGESIILIVEAEDGSFTEIVIPIGIFGVCSENCG